MAGGASGEVIKPGDPGASLLYQLVSHKQEPFMPPNSEPLSGERLALIAAWIQGGALENAGSKTKPAQQAGLTIVVPVAVRGRPAGPPPMPRSLNLEPMARTKRAGAVTALAASPWAPLVALAGQHQVLLYQSETLEFLGVLPFPEGTIHVLKFSHNGSLLLAGGGHEGHSGRVVAWNVVTGERLFQVGDEGDVVLGADISPDQTQVALGGPSKTVRAYSTKDGKLVHEIKKHTDWVNSINYSPDGVLLATGDRASGLYVWEAFTGREYFTLRGHTAAITELSWRADGNVLASASEDGTIKLWEMENGTAFRSWGAGGGATAVQFAHDGRLVSCSRDRHARLWDGNGALLRAFDAFPDIALRAVCSHDGSRVIAGDWTGEVRSWRAADGQLLGRLDSNPPPLAEQIQIAAKDLAEAEATLPHLTALTNSSQKAVEQAAAEMQSAQQIAADSAAVDKIVAGALAQAKTSFAQANATLAPAQKKLAAREVVAKAFAGALAQVKQAASQTKDDADIAAVARTIGELEAKAAKECADSQVLVARLQKSAQSQTDRLNTATRASALAAATATGAAKTLAVRAAAAKALQEKAANDKAAAEAAARRLAIARSTLARCQSAMSVRR
jgi:hypothetical protein